MYKRILALICALLLLTAPALSAPAVDYTLFGSVLHQNPPTEDKFFLTYEGQPYSLLDDCARFDEAMSLYGGKSRAVYEYTLPQGSFSIEACDPLLVGRMTIDVPYRAQLTVLQGNRRSGEYDVIESRELTDVYVDEILLPRAENGAPVLMDRIYLYSYDVSGETKHMAATLYFDYEGFTAGYAGAEAEPISIDDMPDRLVTTDGTMELVKRSSGEYVMRPVHAGLLAAFLPAAICVLMMLLILARRKKSKPSAATEVKAAEPSPAPDEPLSAGHELLRKIQSESLRIGDSEISDLADKIQAICSQMLASADEQPDKAAMLRRFLNYYLPTSLKLLSCLRTVRQRGVSKVEVDKVRTDALHGLDMIVTACQKQLDNLYRDEILDVSADIDVLEQMLARDGFTESGLDKVRSSFNPSDN